MQLVPFPFCCTAAILADFGSLATERDVIQYLKSHAEINCLKAIVTAITTDKQPEINKTLKKLGFKRSCFYTKQQHPDTKVALWYIHCPSLRKRLDKA